MKRLRNGRRWWPPLHPCLTRIYTGTVSVICTGGGLVAVICGYQGWTPDFVNIGQKNFVRFSFFLGIVLIMFTTVWNLSAILFIKMSQQIDNFVRNRREPHKSPQSHLRSYKQPKGRNFSQLSGLLTLGLLSLCMLLELAGTGYLWYVFVRVSKVHDHQLHNPAVNLCDVKYEERVCQEAYQQFQGWFHILRVLLPLLAVLQLPAFLVHCFSWVAVDLEDAHPLSPVHKPDVSFSFSHPHSPINYYGNLTLPERPQTIGQELTPKLATAGTRGVSHKPVCVPCPKAPLGLQVPGHSSCSQKLENKFCSPGLGSHESTTVTDSPRETVYHESSPCMKNAPQRLRTAGESCAATSNQIDVLDDRLGDGGRISSLETSPQLVNKRNFSTTNNQHLALPSSTKASSNSVRNILTNGVLTKPVVLSKSRFPRSKLPSPPPPPKLPSPPPKLPSPPLPPKLPSHPSPPVESSSPRTSCMTNENPSPSRPRRWTTNQVAFSSTDSELLRKVATDKKYAGLSKFSPVCTIENI